jgi:hypothetical protein
MTGQAWALVGAAAAVGILHTMVPDHWAPISLLARQFGWSGARTARVAALAGVGHIVSTLLIAILVWLAGTLLAVRFGHLVSLASSIALIGFGLWIAFGSWREMHGALHADTRNQETPKRTVLLLILGSSPMVEGIPAFFAASRFGAALLAAMAIVFAACTIATYVALSLASARGLQHLRLGRFEEYGEAISGSLIALLGAAFLLWPIA